MSDLQARECRHSCTRGFRNNLGQTNHAVDDSAFCFFAAFEALFNLAEAASVRWRWLFGLSEITMGYF